MLRLRDYQETGIEQLREAFAQGIRRACYTAPCGAGKTAMVIFMASSAALMGKRTLFLTHRVELQDQAAEAFQSSGVHFGIISPRTPMTQDRIQLGSVQTVVRRIEKITAPDLIICDEHHHSVAKTWLKIFTQWPDAFVVGLTATPQRIDGKGLKEVSDILIEGPTTKELIQQGYLAPYRYYAPPQKFSMENIKTKMGDYDQKQVAEAVDKSVIIGDAVQHYQKLADGKRAIVYCASVAHSKHVAQQFTEAGYKSAHLDGETHPIERRRITSDFRSGKLQIISNCDIVSEGYNCPGAEVVILLRPTQSVTLFLQQATRGMRPDKENPEKVSLILDHVSNVSRHGLPDSDREWTLEGATKEKNASKSEFPVRQCPRCYNTHRPAPICDLCGYVYPIEERAELEQKKGELSEVISIEKLERKQAIKKARNVTTLEEIAMKAGYSPFWVKRMCDLKRIPFGGMAVERT